MSIRHKQGDTVYWIYNDSPKLPVIIMLHGFRGTHHGLDLIAKNLPNYKIIVPDLPGFGETKALAVEHNLENYIIWLEKFINNLKLSKPPILLGHSFGSIVASKYASKNPKTISKLVLVNPIGASVLIGSKALFTQISIFYYWLGRKLPEKIATKLLSAKPITLGLSIVMAKTSDKETRKFIHGQHLSHFSSFTNRRSVTEAFKTSILNNVLQTAPNVTTPTLLIAGERDDITSLSNQYKLVEIFPNAKIEVIPGVGHLTHYETPGQVADAIIKFTI